MAAQPARRANLARFASAAATRPRTPPAESAQADGHSLARIKLPACNARKVGSRKRMAAQPARRADLARIASKTRPTPPAASAQADGPSKIKTSLHASCATAARLRTQARPRAANATQESSAAFPEIARNASLADTATARVRQHASSARATRSTQRRGARRMQSAKNAQNSHRTRPQASSAASPTRPRAASAG